MGISAVQSHGGLAGLFAAVSPATAEGTATRSSTAGTAQTTGDVLELSAEGQAAADATSLGHGLLRAGLFGVSPNEDGTISAIDLEAAQEKAQASIQAKLKQRFASAGIDTSQEIRLQMGADGQVYVTNDNPQREQIQQLFVDDPSLRDEFCEFQCLTETVGAIHDGIAFQQAYARDPKAAVAQYWYLFNSATQSSASLVIQGDSYQTLYGCAGRGFEVIGE